MVVRSQEGDSVEHFDEPRTVENELRCAVVDRETLVCSDDGECNLNGEKDQVADIKCEVTMCTVNCSTVPCQENGHDCGASNIDRTVPDSDHESGAFNRDKTVPRRDHVSGISTSVYRGGGVTC